MTLAHLCSIFEPTHYVRKLIGFDTFEGFPSIHEKDASSQAKHMKVGGLAHDSFEYLSKAIELYDTNRHLSHLPKIELIKGDICETVPIYLKENPHLTISMLYLDIDLYEPTKIALETLVSRMPKGALIVFDELNHSDYPGETIALQEVLGIRNISLQRSLFLQWRPMRFLIDMIDGFLKIERFVDQKDLVLLKSVLAELARVQADRCGSSVAYEYFEDKNELCSQDFVFLCKNLPTSPDQSHKYIYANGSL